MKKASGLSIAMAVIVFAIGIISFTFISTNQGDASDLDLSFLPVVLGVGIPILVFVIIVATFISKVKKQGLGKFDITKTVTNGVRANATIMDVQQTNIPFVGTKDPLYLLTLNVEYPQSKFYVAKVFAKTSDFTPDQLTKGKVIPVLVERNNPRKVMVETGSGYTTTTYEQTYSFDQSKQSYDQPKSDEVKTVMDEFKSGKPKDEIINELRNKGYQVEESTTSNYEIEFSDSSTSSQQADSKSTFYSSSQSSPPPTKEETKDPMSEVSGTIEEQLAQLEALYKKGTITYSEFYKKRNELQKRQ